MVINTSLDSTMTPSHKGDKKSIKIEVKFYVNIGSKSGSVERNSDVRQATFSDYPVQKSPSVPTFPSTTSIVTSPNPPLEYSDLRYY